MGGAAVRSVRTNACGGEVLVVDVSGLGHTGAAADYGAHCSDEPEPEPRDERLVDPDRMLEALRRWQ